jgi:hypothetical protein
MRRTPASRCWRSASSALRARGLETRDRARIAGDEKAEHRHRLHRIPPIVDRQQQAKVAQPAQAIEDGQPFAQERFLPGHVRGDGRDLRLEVVTLLLELRLHVDGELQLIRTDAQLEVRFLQIVLGTAGLSPDVVETLAKTVDLGTDAREIGITRRLRVRRGHRRECLCHIGQADREDQHRNGDGPMRPTTIRAMHAWPPAAAPLFSTIPRRAWPGCRPSLRR